MSSSPETPIVCIDLTFADSVLESDDDACIDLTVADSVSPPVRSHFKPTDLKEAIRRSLMDQVNEQLRRQPRKMASDAAEARAAASAMLKIRKRVYRQSRGH